MADEKKVSSMVTIPYPEKTSKMLQELLNTSNGFLILTDKGVLAAGTDDTVNPVILLAYALDTCEDFGRLISEALELLKVKNNFLENVGGDK
jgi:hypothetical protein